MSTPVVLTTSHRALDGHHDELAPAAGAYADFVRRREPGLAALTVALDAEEQQVTFSHVFDDADAADAHLATAADHIQRSFAMTRTTRISVLGTPGPRIAGLLEVNREAGVPVDSVPGAGGFVRR